MAGYDESYNMEAPATGGEQVTPHASTNLTFPSRALYVGVTGNVAVEMVDGTVLTFLNVPVGWMPLRVKRVNAVGTTATEIVSVH